MKTRATLTALVTASLAAASLTGASSLATATSTKVSPTNVSRAVARKYIAALEAKHENALSPLLSRNAVEIDKPEHHRWSITMAWKSVFAYVPDLHWRGQVICAAPHWAVVGWQMTGSTNPYTNGPFRTPGISVLDIAKGKITRETLYYGIPGR